jgi:hypothetical protein
MSRRVSFVLFITCALSLLWQRESAAQLAPTGTHYAGRPTDTGYGGPNDHGGYATSVQLDLPPSRGGLPVPMQIVSGGRGFGALLRFLPPYSPDFNPIEQAFTKLKAFLRVARPHSFDQVCALIATAINLFTSTECANFVRHSGYRVATSL